MTNPEGCSLCEEINSDDARIIAASGLVVVMLSNPRLVEGHTLVVPRRHIEDPNDTTDEEEWEIRTRIKELRAAMIAARLGLGVDEHQHYRPYLPHDGRGITHAHWQLLPRKSRDRLQIAMGLESSALSRLKPDEQKYVGSILRRDPQSSLQRILTG